MDEGRSERARLRWRCRRGTRELDTLLVSFFDRHFMSLPDAEKRLFSQLLELPDPDLHDYLFGWHEAADPAMARLLERIRAR
ncbi:MAG: succinate dehydrogenase assembly factor 2 [Rhodospirillaceae bacterium]|nr:succinate dehydrogenase assembly factor 2 [Rhodospirillaceae bacterium]